MSDDVGVMSEGWRGVARGGVVSGRVVCSYLHRVQ